MSKDGLTNDQLNDLIANTEVPAGWWNEPEGWMQNMQSLFATDDRGDTSVAVAVMLEVFKEDFTDQVQEHQMTLTRMRQLVNPEAPQAGVAVKLDELDKMMEDTNSKAKQYEKELNDQFDKDDTLACAFPRIHVPTSTSLKKVKKAQQAAFRSEYDKQVVEK